MTDEFLNLLRCPEDGSQLHEADEDLLARVNEAIAAGRLQDRGDRSLSEPLQGGLVREAGDVMYPVVHGIPLMLRDDAIRLEQIG